MLTGLLNRLNHEWLPVALTEPLTAIKAAGGDGQLRKVNFLVFAQPSSQPDILMKTVRDRSQQELLKKEFETLLNLNKHENLRGRIPQPIGLFRHAGTLIMVETCLPGIALDNLLRRGKRHSLAEMTQDMNHIQQWLIDFQYSTMQGSFRFRGVEEVAERLKHYPEHLNDRLVEDLNSLAAEARGIEIPQTARHGDFWAGNILISKQDIGIIDWETFCPSASPFDDLFFFATIHSKNCFSSAFLKDTALAHRLSQLSKAVANSLKISPRFMPLFFSLFLLDMAGKRIELGRIGGETPPWQQYLAQIDSLDSLVMSR
jgi:hypothetical protein